MHNQQYMYASHLTTTTIYIDRHIHVHCLKLFKKLNATQEPKVTVYALIFGVMGGWADLVLENLT